MLSPREEISHVLQEALKGLGIMEIEITVEHPSDPSHGDYSSNIALIGAKLLKQKPIELGKNIKNQISKIKDLEKIFDRIEVVKPGFINFWLSNEYLSTHLSKLLVSDRTIPTGNLVFKGKKLLIEFAHPNTHKELHIGHLRNITLGEAICRLLEVNGAAVARVNYQGDVGLHVAKALYGMLKSFKFKGPFGPSSGRGQSSKLTLEEKAKLLGQAYAEGSKAYEEDEHSREKIAKINKQIYERDPEILPQWQKTRQWSLDYFDEIYKRLGTRFDRLYFESEVYESGRVIVLSHIQDGIFARDQGAIIFDGERYGLHKRVFVTKEGNPTYEGKEMALGPLQYKEFSFDKAIHIVGPEQAGYFRVVFKALELIYPALKEKEMHLSYGLVGLRKGKMSSRMGNVISAEWLLDEAKIFLKKQFTDMSEETLERVAVGAVKYSMLKFGLSQQINFSFEESISLEGSSGPYLQYTYARTQSVIAKASSFKRGPLSPLQRLEPEERSLLRSLHRFPEVVEEAAELFAPNLLCNYLFDLAQKFNLFYQKQRILGVEPLKQHDNTINFRLALTEGVGKMLKHGLYLLGIEAPEKM